MFNYFIKKKFFVKACCIHISDSKLNFEACFDQRFRKFQEAHAEMKDAEWLKDCFPEYHIAFSVGGGENEEKD